MPRKKSKTSSPPASKSKPTIAKTTVKKSKKKKTKQLNRADKPTKNKTKQKVLLKKAAKLPQTGGLYAWLDENGQPIYIGKSKNVRKRVRQHIVKGKSTKDVDKVLTEAEKPVFKYVQQPAYADKLEKIAVRAYKPKYNENDFLP